MAFFNLIGGIKGIAIILLIAALGGYVYVQKRNVEKAELARDQAIAQRDSVVVERDKAIAAARTNADTIDRLQEEKADINTALNNLAAAQVANRNTTVKRQTTINSQAAVPANAAQVAPTVGDTIDDIQQSRAARRPQ